MSRPTGYLQPISASPTRAVLRMSALRRPPSCREFRSGSAAGPEFGYRPSELEWAAIWKPLTKVVFSTTLSAVEGHARLASGGLAEEIERLRPEPRATDN